MNKRAVTWAIEHVLRNLGDVERSLRDEDIPKALADLHHATDKLRLLASNMDESAEG